MSAQRDPIEWPHHALYIIGEPGVGKSELVEQLTKRLPVEELREPVPHRVYSAGSLAPVTELGVRRVEFSGTDALSMSIQPKAIAWLVDEQPRHLIAEGDRLANDAFFHALIEHGYELDIVLLFGPGVAARRRHERGSHQDTKWLEGRRSKVMRLAQGWRAHVQVLDARDEPAVLALKVESPVAEALRELREVAG